MCVCVLCSLAAYHHTCVYTYIHTRTQMLITLKYHISAKHNVIRILAHSHLNIVPLTVPVHDWVHKP